MRLQELIATRKKDLGLTYADLVQRSAAAGHPISRSMFHHFITGEWSNVPTTEALRGIAAAIELDPDEVLAAAAESVGITFRELDIGRGTRAVLALLADRSDEETAALAAVLRSVIEAMNAPPAQRGELPGEHVTHRQPCSNGT